MFLHPCLIILYWVLGFTSLSKVEKVIFFLPPCVLHGFVHPGTILRPLRWMQDQTSGALSFAQAVYFTVRHSRRRYTIFQGEGWRRTAGESWI